MHTREIRNIYNRKDEFKKELARLEKTDILAVNKAIITEYLHHELAKPISESRAAKVGGLLRRLAILFAKDFQECTKKDIERVLGCINTNASFKGNTKIDYRKAIKHFFKYLYPNDLSKIHELVGWFNAKEKVRDRKVYDVLKSEEKTKLLEACDNLRDRAFIAFLMETGCRPSEALSCHIGDWDSSFGSYAYVVLRGKTGERRIPLVECLPYVNRYIDIHPERADPEAPLWISIGTYRHNEALNYIGARKIIKRVFNKAGVPKHKAFMYNVRHTRVTELCGAGVLNNVQQCLNFGWEIGSKQVATYYHSSGKELDEPILKYYGVKKDCKKQSNNTPKICLNCNSTNGPISKFCFNCGKSLMSAEETDALVTDEINKTVQFFMEMSKNPELMKKFEEFKKGGNL